MHAQAPHYAQRDTTRKTPQPTERTRVTEAAHDYIVSPSEKDTRLVLAPQPKRDAPGNGGDR